MVTSAPTCAFCGRSRGVQFNTFTPRFEPFGTACVDCEASLPEGTPHPDGRDGICPTCDGPTQPGHPEPSCERCDALPCPGCSGDTALHIAGWGCRRWATRQQPGSVPCADGFHEHETEDEATACSACIRDIHENAAADCERDER